MTDRETLFIYRMNEAEETLTDTRKMLESGISTRSVVNRAYYAIFYGIILIAQSFPFLWQEIFSEARQKDFWVEPLEIARTIEEFPVDLLAAVKWEQPVDPDACTAALKTLHSDIFHGSGNSLHIMGISF